MEPLRISCLMKVETCVGQDAYRGIRACVSKFYGVHRASYGCVELQDDNSVSRKTLPDNLPAEVCKELAGTVQEQFKRGYWTPGFKKKKCNRP